MIKKVNVFRDRISTMIDRLTNRHHRHGKGRTGQAAAATNDEPTTNEINHGRQTKKK